MADTVKVVVRYDTPFWRGRGLAGAAVSHAGPLREIHDMSGPDGSPAALFGFAVGATPSIARRLQDRSLQQLTRLFGHPAYQEPTLGGRLHWATTETATANAGHIDGALQAASRAASAVLRRHHLAPTPC